MTTDPVHIVGGGLAGSEAAWQAAQAGVPVILHEMRGLRGTDAYKTDHLAELVCSNSFRSDDAQGNAVGVLHAGVEYHWWQGITACSTMVSGDGISTDVDGGRRQGLDTLFITGGLAAEHLGPDVENPEDALLTAWLAGQGHLSPSSSAPAPSHVAGNCRSIPASGAVSRIDRGCCQPTPSPQASPRNPAQSAKSPTGTAPSPAAERP